MSKFVAGIIVGIFVATVGLDGVASLLNRGVTEVQDLSKQLVEQ